MAYSKNHIQQWAERIWGRFGGQLAALMGLSLQELNISVVRGADPRLGGGVAAADARSNTILLSVDHFKNNLDVGGLIHEGAHALGDISREAFSGLSDGQFTKMIEGAADAVRVRLGLDDNGEWEPSRFASRLADLKDSEFKQVTRSMADGTYSRHMLRQIENGTFQGNPADGVGSPVQPANGMPGDYVGGTNWGGTANQNQGGAGNTGGASGDANNNGIPDFLEQQNDDADKEARAARRRQEEELRAGFSNTLLGWGIPLSGNLQTLVERAGNRLWGLDRFLEVLRDTPEYRQAFPGIFNQDGTLKMSEEAYKSYEQQYQGYASQAGIDLNDRKMAYLFRHDVTPQEFADKAVAFGRLQRNPELYKAFSRELVQGGVAKPGEVDKKGLYRYIMGEGNKEWYDLWQDAVTRNAAVQAGITFKKGKDSYLNLGQGVIERISGLGLSESEIASGFLNVEEQLRTTLPLTESGRYGLSKKDVVSAVFGGKGASRARATLDRVLKTNEAFEEGQRANQQVTTSQEGGAQIVGGQSRRAQY